MKTNRTSVKSIRLKESLINQIEQMAETQNRNFNNMVETILIQATQNEPMNRV